VSASGPEGSSAGVAAASTRGALHGWRVLEIADGVAASFCGKVLADLGADVVKVEPPGGHAARRWGPRRSDAGPTEPGGRFLYLNTSKWSVVADGAQGLDEVGRLAAACDVVVTDDRCWYERDGLDEATVVIVVTPFGLTGPYAAYWGNHLVAFHAGGEGSILPSGTGWELFPDRPPIQAGSLLSRRSPRCTTACGRVAASASTCPCRSRSSR
jgi:crotonobetainyl-CoA:carnitine CoA-transferase CaiB-like acyl-CoA transferase